jgi:hypothetical protein
MNSKKAILNHLLDIGGVGTLNNFYNPTSKTHQGSLVRTREHFKFFLENAFIAKLDFIGKPRIRLVKCFIA